MASVEKVPMLAEGYEKLTAQLSALKAERPLTRKTFERYTALMSRVPGLTLQAQVPPPGTSATVQVNFNFTGCAANARFTVSAKRCPSYSPMAEDPQGVPIAAIVIGLQIAIGGLNFSGKAASFNFGKLNPIVDASHQPVISNSQCLDSFSLVQ